MNTKLIFNKLMELKENAYVPYSDFYVAAIVKSNDKYYYGVNIENSSYPVTLCAERSAIAAAISSGNRSIDEVYLLTKSNGFGMPCGMCRQFMSDFMKDDNQKIYVFNKFGQYKIYTIGEILKNRFTHEDLINR